MEIKEIIKARMAQRQKEKENLAMAESGGVGQGIAKLALGLGAGFSDALTGKDATGRVIDLMNRGENARLKALESEDGIDDLMDLYKIQQTADLQRELAKMREAGDLQAKMIDYSKFQQAQKQDKEQFEKRFGQDAAQFYAQLKADQEKAAKAPTEGEKTLDREFAKDYSRWMGAGKAEFNKNLTKLERAIDKLKQAKGDTFGYTGRWTVAVPDAMRSEGRALRQDVEQAAVASLRETLGAQFTEKEGARIMAQSFDPLLSEEQNIQKITDTINELKERAATMEARANFFKQNRTLKGIDGVSNAPNSGRVMVTNGQETLEIDASDFAEAQRDGFRLVQ